MPTMLPNNFVGGLFGKTNVCCQMGAVKKMATYLVFWSLTRRVQLGGVQLSFTFVTIRDSLVQHHKLFSWVEFS
jgi:hypothetical protein